LPGIGEDQELSSGMRHAGRQSDRFSAIVPVGEKAHALILKFTGNVLRRISGAIGHHNEFSGNMADLDVPRKLFKATAEMALLIEHC
jgi:hypothetical protein